MIRTDLAMEAKTLFEQSAGRTTRLEGVRARERREDGVKFSICRLSSSFLRLVACLCLLALAENR